jgi:hypothetical protein
LNDSTASLFGGTISHNQATGGTGAGPSDPLQTVYLSSGAAFGGGISAQGASSASITRTTFLNDTARSGNSSTVATASSVTRAGNASGGAIDFDTGGNLILTRATLNHNSAIGGNAGAAPGSAFGGGIATDGANSVTIVKSTMQGNLAETGQGFVSSPDVSTEYALASGGAIYVDNAATSLSMSASRIIANRAVGNDNGAASGGGLMLNDVAADLTNDTLQSNKVIGGSISTSVLGQATGGAIAITGSTMTLTNSRLVNNQATTATVDELYGDPGSSSDASLGGAIFNEGADVQIVGGSFVGNQAIGGTGTDYTAGANGQGGAIFSIGSGDYGNDANALVTVTGVMFQNNLAAGGAVATQLEFVPSTAGAGEGGAIDIEEYSQLDLSSSKVTANQAMATGNGSGNGGGLYLAALSTNTLAQDTVVKNTASTAGDNIDNLSQ